MKAEGPSLTNVSYSFESNFQPSFIKPTFVRFHFEKIGGQAALASERVFMEPEGPPWLSMNL